MQLPRVTLGRAIWVFAGVVVLALTVGSVATGPAHEVHSPGAAKLDVQVYPPDTCTFAAPCTSMIQPAVVSQSLDQIRCSLWAQSPPRYGRTSGQTCAPAVLESTIFPSAVQTPNTMYLAWRGCVVWSGHGSVIPWQGFNLEYMPASRTVVLHCYISKPWLWFPDRLMGFAALPAPVLVAIPTSSIGTGTLNIDEDDRIEHLIGDQSTEYRLASALIS